MLSTLTIPLDKSWSNSTLEIVSTDNPSDFPILSVQSLWWDGEYSQSLYAFGGGTSITETDTVDPLSVWMFLPEEKVWAERFGPDANIWQNLTRSSRCGSVYTPNAGFCLGGYSGPYSTDVDPPPMDTPLQGMIQFNFESLTWDNVSSTGASQQGFLVSSQMEYIPAYGKEGILVSMGGDAPVSQDQYYPGSNQMPMSDITIYDIKSQQWYSQTATGDVPDGRSEFCSIIAHGGDNESWEMLVYLFYSFIHPPRPARLVFTVLGFKEMLTSH